MSKNIDLWTPPYPVLNVAPTFFGTLAIFMKNRGCIDSIYSLAYTTDNCLLKSYNENEKRGWILNLDYSNMFFLQRFDNRVSLGSGINCSLPHLRLSGTKETKYARNYNWVENINWLFKVCGHRELRYYFWLLLSLVI